METESAQESRLGQPKGGSHPSWGWVEASNICSKTLTCDEIKKMIPLRITKNTSIREENIKINAKEIGCGLNGFKLDHDKGQ